MLSPMGHKEEIIESTLKTITTNSNGNIVLNANFGINGNNHILLDVFINDVNESSIYGFLNYNNYLNGQLYYGIRVITATGTPQAVANTDVKVKILYKNR